MDKNKIELYKQYIKAKQVKDIPLMLDAVRGIYGLETVSKLRQFVDNLSRFPVVKMFEDMHIEKHLLSECLTRLHNGQQFLVYLFDKTVYTYWNPPESIVDFNLLNLSKTCEELGIDQNQVRVYDVISFSNLQGFNGRI
jgi:hypothetical protein